MTVRVVVPGAVVACAAALSGCGSDEDRASTVTVTAPATATTVAVVPPARTTTVTRTRTSRATPRTVARPATTVRTVAVPTTPVARERPARRQPAERGSTDDFSPDPVGGTTVARGRVEGTGYSVRVPDGWNDGARRFEGSGVAFDRTYVKGRGNGVTSNILIVRTPDTRARGRTAVDLRASIRRRLEAAAGGADVTSGPVVGVDGEDALTFVTRQRIGPTAVVQRQVAVVRDGAVYVVGLNAPADTADEDARVFRQFLRSWRWR